MTAGGRHIRRGLRLMLEYARAHPVTFGISVFGSVIFAVASVAFTVALGRLTDDVIAPEFGGPGEATGVAAVFAALLGIALLRSVGIVGRRFFAGLTVIALRRDYQRALADHYLALPYRHLRSASRGRLLAYTDTEVEEAIDAVSPMPFSIGVFTMIFVGIASLLAVDPYLTFIAVLLLPSLLLLNRFYAELTAPPSLAIRESINDVTSIAGESFDGAIIVKTLGRTDEEIARFASASAELRDAHISLAKVRAVFESAVATLPELAVVVLVLVGGWRVGEGAITEGQLVQAVALFGVLSFPIHVIGYFIGGLTPAVVAADRIRDVLEQPTEHRTGTRALPDGPLQVAVHNLDLAHDDETIVTDLTFDVAAGEVVALVGPTGSGKTTLFETIAGLLTNREHPSDDDRVVIGGVPVGSIAADELSSRVTLAFQEPYLLGAAVAENIAFGVEIADVDLEWAVHAAGIAETVAALPDGVDTVLGERGINLSGGQRQRVALARAIARRPGLMLLDDATSAVDPVVEERILEHIRELDTTVLVVAHRRSTIALADRVVFVADGRLVADGTHDHLFATVPEYRALLRAYDSEARHG